MSLQQFIVTSLGSLGDVYPFLGIGAKLVRRGHQVTLLSFDHYGPAARAAGMDFVSIGRWAEVEGLLAQCDVNEWRRMVKLLAHIMTAYMPATYEAIAERARPGTKLIAFPPMLGARFASERLGLPLATVHLAPAGIRSVDAAPRFNRVTLPPSFLRVLAPVMYAMLDKVFDRELRPEVASFRRSLGLPPLKHIRRSLDSEDLVIGLFPEWFAPQQPDWPERASTAHFPLYDASDNRPLTPELAAFLRNGEPPIAFTGGSPTQSYGAFYRTSVEACAALNRRGLLITRYRADVPANLPPTIAHADYAPFSKVLPHVAAFVHHGGIGTSAQALRAGVPQLVVPWGIDQFDNAKWLSQLGVAREVSVTSYRTSTVAAALHRLLADENVLANCRDVAARFEGVDTLESVCAQLEALPPALTRTRGYAEHATTAAASI
jgi:rhamnosyltransferase subunit B